MSDVSNCNIYFICIQARQTRNDIFHSGEYKLTQENLVYYINTMVAVIQLSNDFDRTVERDLKQVCKSVFPVINYRNIVNMLNISLFDVVMPIKTQDCSKDYMYIVTAC